jgi:hypothetical protein
MKKAPKYEVGTIGPGSLGGQKFTSATEALAFARYLILQGTEVRITPLKAGR